jgi:hypothetical protein
MPRGRRRIEKEPPVPVTYEVSHDVEEVMARVERLYPDQFSWAKNFHLGAVIVRGSKPKEVEGCFTLARFVKVPPLWHGLSGYDGIVRVEEWAWTRLAPSEQEALIVHELCHGSMSERGTLRTLRHDLEEFGFVVRKYGAWRDAVVIFDKQLSLFEPGLGRDGKLGEQRGLDEAAA